MGGCFLATLYAGYTGWQWRTLRTIGVELKAAKAEAKAAKDAIAAVTREAAADADDEHHAAPAPASLLAAQSTAEALVTELTDKRAAIAAGNFRDVHYQMGTILLAFGIPMALEGPVNTYMRAGKLFPGAHVYAGVGVASLWAVAAALARRPSGDVAASFKRTTPAFQRRESCRGRVAALPRGATWICRGRVAAPPRGATWIFRGRVAGLRLAAEQVNAGARDAKGQGVGADRAHRRQRRHLRPLRVLPDPDGSDHRGQGHREDQVPVSLAVVFSLTTL